MVDATHQVIVVEKKIPMEEVEVLEDRSVKTDQGFFTGGHKAHVYASEVSGLVLSGAVKRLDQSKAAPGEKAAEQRANVAVLEAKAIELEKIATPAMSAAITTGSKEQQDEAKKLVDKAIVARNNATKAADDMVKAEEAAAKAAVAAKEKADAEASAKLARVSVTDAGPMSHPKTPN